MRVNPGVSKAKVTEFTLVDWGDGQVPATEYIIDRIPYAPWPPGTVVQITGFGQEEVHYAQEMAVQLWEEMGGWSTIKRVTWSGLWDATVEKEIGMVPSGARIRIGRVGANAIDMTTLKIIVKLPGA